MFHRDGSCSKSSPPKARTGGLKECLIHGSGLRLPTRWRALSEKTELPLAGIIPFCRTETPNRHGTQNKKESQAGEDIT